MRRLEWDLSCAWLLHMGKGGGNRLCSASLSESWLRYDLLFIIFSLKTSPDIWTDRPTDGQTNNHIDNNVS